jgi:hypothetical protein
MTIRACNWLGLVLLAASGPLAALDSASSHIALPGGDELWLAIPAGWNEKFDSPSTQTPPSVWLTPREGASFNVLITPLSGTTVGAAMADDQKLRAIVTSASRNALARSVEMSIPVHELSGPKVFGFYFFATDRAPAPGEWKYMTTGMVNIDRVPFLFTILTNDGQETVAKTALDLIRAATYHPSM